jgi:predicted TPR repeat methyltransferase
LSDTGGSEHSQGAYDLQSAFKASNSQEAAELYDSWAEGYERSVSSWGYTTPAVATWFLGRYVEPKEGTVLDAGAGTGITGEILALLGYEDVVGMDVSNNMLEIARKKGVYKDCRRMTLGERLDFPDDAFAAVVATGVFAAGHAPPESFEELTRIIRPGGHAVFSVRTDVYEDGGFKEKQEALESEERWRLLAMSDPFAHLRFEDPNLKVRVFAYEVR